MDNLQSISNDSQLSNNSQTPLPDNSTQHLQHKSNKYLLPVLIILLGITAVNIYFGLRNYFDRNELLIKKTTTEAKTNEIIDNQVVDKSKNPSKPSDLQANPEIPFTDSLEVSDEWSVVSDNKCGVKFTIPPKKEPYFYPKDINHEPSITNDIGSGRFWDFPRGVIYAEMLSQILNDGPEYQQEIASFSAKEETSGYISQSVAVSCLPNNGRISDNNSLISELTKSLEKYNSSIEKSPMLPESYKIEKTISVSRWQNDVVDLVVAKTFPGSGGYPSYTELNNYTMFVTPKYVYEVVKTGQSADPFVIETGQKIFDNLVFK